MTTNEIVTEAVKVSPPVTVSGFYLAGHTLDTWVALMTLLYLVLQIGWFFYSKFLRKRDNGSNE